jgi:hypothetical protein
MVYNNGNFTFKNVAASTTQLTDGEETIKVNANLWFTIDISV